MKIIFINLTETTGREIAIRADRIYSMEASKEEETWLYVEGMPVPLIVQNYVGEILAAMNGELKDVPLYSETFAGEK